MSNLYVSSEYKNKIINLLYKNDNFITLINPTPSSYDELDIIDVLNGGEWIINGKKVSEQGHVFDYEFADETTNDQKTFVFVETTVYNITDNMFLDFDLYIFIFTYKDLVRLGTDSVPTAKQVKNMGYFATSTRGNRIDALCDCVDGILNGCDKLASIGDVTPASNSFMTMYRPNSNYYGKCLRYKITNYNADGDDCGN